MYRMQPLVIQCQLMRYIAVCIMHNRDSLALYLRLYSWREWYRNGLRRASTTGDTRISFIVECSTILHAEYTPGRQPYARFLSFLIIFSNLRCSQLAILCGLALCGRRISGAATRKSLIANPLVRISWPIAASNRAENRAQSINSPTVTLFLGGILAGPVFECTRNWPSELKYSHLKFGMNSTWNKKTTIQMKGNLAVCWYIRISIPAIELFERI